MANYIFTPQETAMAYTMAAKRIWANDNPFLEKNPALIPVLVFNLFQSLEISIKTIGISAGLFTEKEARQAPRVNGKPTNGHAIEELANLAIRSIKGQSRHKFLSALICAKEYSNHLDLVECMIFGEEFKKTRKYYESRHLGYGQVNNNDFSIESDFEYWINVLESIAKNAPSAIKILSSERI